MHGDSSRHGRGIPAPAFTAQRSSRGGGAGALPRRSLLVVLSGGRAARVSARRVRSDASLEAAAVSVAAREPASQQEGALGPGATLPPRGARARGKGREARPLDRTGSARELGAAAGGSRGCASPGTTSPVRAAQVDAAGRFPRGDQRGAARRPARAGLP